MMNAKKGRLLLSAVVVLLAGGKGLAQCPQWIQEPLQKTAAFMGLMEQRLSFRFTDSSISQVRDRIIYNDPSGRYILRVSLKNNIVQKLYFEAPADDITLLTRWYTDAFKECLVSGKEDIYVFPGYVVINQAVAGKPRRVFYMEPH